MLWVVLQVVEETQRRHQEQEVNTNQLWAEYINSMEV